GVNAPPLSSVFIRGDSFYSCYSWSWSVSGRRLDRAAQRAEVAAVVAELRAGVDLLGFQFGDLLRPGPDDGPAAGVRLEHELEGPLGGDAEHLAERLDDEAHRVVVVVEQDHVVGRDAARLRRGGLDLRRVAHTGRGQRHRRSPRWGCLTS